MLYFFSFCSKLNKKHVKNLINNIYIYIYIYIYISFFRVFSLKELSFFYLIKNNAIFINLYAYLLGQNRPKYIMMVKNIMIDR